MPQKMTFSMILLTILCTAQAIFDCIYITYSFYYTLLLAVNQKQVHTYITTIINHHMHLSMNIFM